jgi:hypothetical protein
LSVGDVILLILILWPTEPKSTPIYKQPNHEPVKSLINFGKSANDPQKYHKKKRSMYTVEEVQWESEWVSGYTKTGVEKRLSLRDRKMVIISSTLNVD